MFSPDEDPGFILQRTQRIILWSIHQPDVFLNHSISQRCSSPEVTRLNKICFCKLKKKEHINVFASKNINIYVQVNDCCGRL